MPRLLVRGDAAASPDCHVTRRWLLSAASCSCIGDPHGTVKPLQGPQRTNITSNEPRDHSYLCLKPYVNSAMETPESEPTLCWLNQTGVCCVPKSSPVLVFAATCPKCKV